MQTRNPEEKHAFKGNTKVLNSSSANILLSPASEAGFAGSLFQLHSQRHLKKSPFLSSSPAALWVVHRGRSSNKQAQTGHTPDLTTEKNVKNSSYQLTVELGESACEDHRLLLWCSRGFNAVALQVAFFSLLLECCFFLSGSLAEEKKQQQQHRSNTITINVVQPKVLFLLNAEALSTFCPLFFSRLSELVPSDQNWDRTKICITTDHPKK